MKSVRVALLVLVALAAASPRAEAQEVLSDNAQAGFSNEHIGEMVGPIALYPDALVAQILMAATYPVEIVQAGRWLGANRGLSGDALNGALQGQNWDLSVKSLCNFPTVVQRMSDNLNWTQDLGEAFLSQKAAVMDAIQRLRVAASAAGNLTSTDQQTVNQEPTGILTIQPTDPSTLYLPVYYPSSVYGLNYPVPYYPALYRPIPAAYPATTFAAGVATGGCLYANCNWARGRGDVSVNVNTYNTYNKNTNVNAASTNISSASGNNVAAWNHDAQSRQNVNYSNTATANAYKNSSAASGSGQSQAQSRGYGSAPAAQAAPRAANYGGGNSAFSGVGNGGMEQQASDRGAESRGFGGGGFRGRR